MKTRVVFVCAVLAGMAVVGGCSSADDDDGGNGLPHSGANPSPGGESVEGTAVVEAAQPAVPVQVDDCVDPVHCTGSEEDNTHPVGDPVRPEEGWQALGPQHEQPCNGIDEDGDGLDHCPGDHDGDGTTADFDCDDNDSTRYVAAVEVLCDSIDQNCDGVHLCDGDHDGVFNVADCDDNDPSIKDECFHQEPSGPLP